MLLTSRNSHLVANKSVHTVERICCVCRKLQPITSMLRVVRINGEFMVQGAKRLNGRGAHVCPSCVDSANLIKSLSRSFKSQLPKEIIRQISQPSGK